MSAKHLSKDFTQGSIAKQLFWFTLPFMASNGMQVLYSTIDMIVVGKYVGTAGLSAVSQSSQILNLSSMGILWICFGLWLSCVWLCHPGSSLFYLRKMGEAENTGGGFLMEKKFSVTFR